jgi:uncharacterized protein YcsI (UPF0317 family)
MSMNQLDKRKEGAGMNSALDTIEAVCALEGEIKRLRALNAELVAALEAITDHFAAVMGDPFLAGVTFANGVEGIPTIAKARAALAKAKATEA